MVLVVQSTWTHSLSLYLQRNLETLTWGMDSVYVILFTLAIEHCMDRDPAWPSCVLWIRVPWAAVRVQPSQGPSRGRVLPQAHCGRLAGPRSQLAAGGSPEPLTMWPSLQGCSQDHSGFPRAQALRDVNAQERSKSLPFCGIISEVPCSHFCWVPRIRKQSRGPACSAVEGILQDTNARNVQQTQAPALCQALCWQPWLQRWAGLVSSLKEFSDIYYEEQREQHITLGTVFIISSILKIF